MSDPDVETPKPVMNERAQENQESEEREHNDTTKEQKRLTMIEASSTSSHFDRRLTSYSARTPVHVTRQTPDTQADEQADIKEGENDGQNGRDQVHSLNQCAGSIDALSSTPETTVKTDTMTVTSVLLVYQSSTA